MERDELKEKIEFVQAKYKQMKKEMEELAMQCEAYAADANEINELKEKNEYLNDGYEQMKKEKKQLISKWEGNILKLKEIYEAKENGMNIKINELNKQIEELTKT